MARKRRYSKSASTPTKDKHFREIVKTHIRCASAIIRKSTWADRSYHYWDLNAGPGIDGQGRVCSPLEFVSQADFVDLNYRAWFFEWEKSDAERLANFCNARCEVIVGDHNKKAPPLIEEIPRHVAKNIYGLVYSDQSGNMPPFPLLQQFSERFRYVDILVYVSSANIKRGLKAFPGKRRLSELMATVHKKFWIIREPKDIHQWTFLIGSNWDNFPQFEALGFYRLDSPKGREIMYRLDTTGEERKANLYRGQNGQQRGV